MPASNFHNMADFPITVFQSGVHNRDDVEDTPKDSAQDELNWITLDGIIELARGKVTVGPEGAAGSCPTIHVGYKVNGVSILWRKISTKIQYFNGSAWIDVVLVSIRPTSTSLQTTARSPASTHSLVVRVGSSNSLMRIQIIIFSSTFQQIFIVVIPYRQGANVSLGDHQRPDVSLPKSYRCATCRHELHTSKHRKSRKRKRSAKDLQRYSCLQGKQCESKLRTSDNKINRHRRGNIHR